MSWTPLFIMFAFTVGVLFGTYCCRPAWRKRTEDEKALDDLIYRLSFKKPLMPNDYPQDVGFIAWLLHVTLKREKDEEVS